MLGGVLSREERSVRWDRPRRGGDAIRIRDAVGHQCLKVWGAGSSAKRWENVFAQSVKHNQNDVRQVCQGLVRSANRCSDRERYLDLSRGRSRPNPTNMKAWRAQRYPNDLSLSSTTFSSLFDILRFSAVFTASLLSQSRRTRDASSSMEAAPLPGSSSSSLSHSSFGTEILRDFSLSKPFDRLAALLLRDCREMDSYLALLRETGRDSRLA
jgi:hypothetical protein